MPEKKEIFSCRQCGQCCEGKGGIVLSSTDLVRLAAFLQLSAQEVIAEYGEYSNGKLKIRAGEDGYCVFYRPGKSCTVHEGKPDICRAWPFFRGNLVDPLSLDMAKAFCAGIRQDASFEEFVMEGLTVLEKEGLLASDPATEANALILTRP